MHLWIIDDRYRVGERVRQQGPVDVYDGIDTETGEAVRIKQFGADLARNMAFVEGWRGQLLSVQEFDLPTVQRILGFGRGPDETLYQVEEPPAGSSLSRWLRRTQGTATVAATIRLIARIADALAEIHRSGVSHGGLSPDTIHIVEDSDGNTSPCFTGWEQGELFAVDAAPARLNRYQPPERHVLPERPHAASTDVYSLGYILYELLTQDTPYPTDMVPDEDVDLPDPVPPSRYNPEISDALERIVLRALDPDPAMRPPHAGALARSLRQALSAQATVEPIKVPRARTSVVTEREDSVVSRPLLLGLGGILAILAIAIIALVWQLSSEPETEPAPVGTTPNIVGMPLETADELARSGGLTVEVSGTVPTTGEPPNTVLVQEPAPGRLVPEDRVIRVSVAGEPPTPAAVTTVPNLFGLSVPVAERMLRENGLSLGDTREAHDEAVPTDLIIEQNPRNGIAVAEGTAVDVIISRGPPPTSTETTPTPGEN